MIMTIFTLIMQNVWIFIGGEAMLGYIPFFDGRSIPDPKKNQGQVIMLNIINFALSLIFDIYFLIVITRFEEMWED